VIMSAEKVIYFYCKHFVIFLKKYIF